MAFLADDDVVVHGDAERARHRNDLLRHLDVGARRRRVAGGVIVDETSVVAIQLMSRTILSMPIHLGTRIGDC